MDNSDSTNNLAKVGRLAFRVEGAIWTAWYIPEGKTESQQKIYLGSIIMSAVRNTPERRQAFMDLMRAVVEERIKDATGIKPEWGDPEVAPTEEVNHG